MEQTGTPVEFTIARATGPRTQNGKAIVSQNAFAHGIYSSRPVIPGAETEEEWDAFRAGIVESFHPEDAAQLALAERAAECFWRLRRVARFEAVVTADKLDRADLDAAPQHAHGIATLRADVESKQSALDRLRRFPSLPDDAPVSNDDAWEIVGAGIDAVEDADEERFTVPDAEGARSVHYLSFFKWTARHVRDALAYLARLSDGKEHSWPDATSLLEALTADAEHDLASAQALVSAHEREADRLRRRRALPASKSLDRAMRTEAHLSRQLTTALHELEALQNRRAGLPTHLARIDVNGEIPEMPKQTP